MPKITKESIRRSKIKAAQAKRDAQCQANGHVWRNEYNHLRYCETCFEIEEFQWIQPNMTIIHRNDPLWIGKVLSVTKSSVHVRRIVDDTWGEHGSIECTFQPNELIIQAESESYHTR